MFLPEGVRRRVQVSVAPESGGESTFEIYSRPDDDERRRDRVDDARHADRSCMNRTIDSGAAMLERDRLGSGARSRRHDSSHDEFYESMAERGLAYGPAFHVLERIASRRGRCRRHACSCRNRSSAKRPRITCIRRWATRCCKSMAGAVPLEEDGSFSPFTYMPVGIRSVRVLTTIDDFTQPLFAYAVRTCSDSGPSPERVEANVYLVTAERRSARRVRRRASAAAGPQRRRRIRRPTPAAGCIEIAWREEPLAVNAIRASAQPHGAGQRHG